MYHTLEIIKIFNTCTTIKSVMKVTAALKGLMTEEGNYDDSELIQAVALRITKNIIQNQK